MLADEVRMMPSDGAWTVFFLQLPALVLAVAVIVVAMMALRRARPADIPKLVELLMTAITRRSKVSSPDRKDPDDNVTTSQRENR